MDRRALLSFSGFLVAGRGEAAALTRLRLGAFEAVVTAEDVTRRKPDPEGLLKCAAALDVEPAHTAYVGDTPPDVQAGRAAGMFTIAVLSGAGDSAALSASGADHLAASLARVPDLVRQNVI